jgi:hypothetical protein
MRNLTVFLIATTFALLSHAGCQRIGTMTVCDDGNTYHQIGNTTFGSNSRTGSSWSQTQIGNSTYGSASDGSTWNSHRYGNSSFGTDSRGKSWSCIGNVCN